MPGGIPQDPNHLTIHLSPEAQSAVVQRMKKTGQRTLLKYIQRDLELQLVGFGADPRFRDPQKNVPYDVNINRADGSGQILVQVTLVVTARRTIARGASQYDVPTEIMITRFVFPGN